MRKVLLDGAPDGLNPVHLVRGPGIPDRLVVPYYGQHQHFELGRETALWEGEEVPVFSFTYATAIAE
ncbi:DUF5988 family protein [Streptomyces roseus]|uniref:DUF5988 family protein n=1 Tax=Streptomyces roseus TaxID=66430 RepID=UPI0036B1AFE1